MSSTSRGATRLASALKQRSSSTRHICLSCRRTQSQQQQQPQRQRVQYQHQTRRGYASTATATAAAVESPPAPGTLVPKAHFDHPQISRQQATVKVHVGVVLSRAPILTPDPHPFETAYYLYQRRLNERLALPFTQYFYYKRGTPAFEHWRTKRRERGNVAARDIGKYNPHDGDGWNDEVLVGDRTGQPEEIVKILLDDEGKDAQEEQGVSETVGGQSKLGGLRRRTGSDEMEDTRSLERSLSRTLYLLVKKGMLGGGGKKERWEFPSAPVEGAEGLKEGAMRVLDTSCGVNMNTWFVGSHPVGHLVHHFTNAAPSKKVVVESTTTSSSTSSTEAKPETEEKTFFLKARIMAGQADVADNVAGVQDFVWLAKEEIQGVVTPAYWSRVKNMLVDQ